MSCFTYTDLISSLLDPKLVDPGSTLIHVDANGPKSQFQAFGNHLIFLLTECFRLFHLNLFAIFS